MFNVHLSADEKLQYKKELYANDLKYIRVLLLLCVFLYSTFSIIDYLSVHDRFLEFSIVRFGFVNPVFLLVFLMSFHRNFFQLHQKLLLVAYIVAGLGICYMLIAVPENFSYYGGLFLIFATGHFITRLRWNAALFGSLFILFVYTFGSIIYAKGLTVNITVYTFFYIGFLIIGGYGSYTYDYYRKEKFIQTFTLKGDNVILEKEIYNNMLDIENANRITIYSMARLAESRDHYTGSHIDRVGDSCLELAKKIDEYIYERNNIIKSEFLKTIELASTIHDIGKISTPENILLKPGPLNKEEMDIMKRHTIDGYETLSNIKDKYDKNNFINMGLDICKYHHERFDGTGYPEGLSGETIPLSARIVSIIDVYDALLSERPYKKAFTVERAIAIMKEEKGKMFDPEILEIFLYS